MENYFRIISASAIWMAITLQFLLIIIRDIRDNLKTIADNQRKQTGALRDLTKEISKISKSFEEKDKH